MRFNRLIPLLFIAVMAGAAPRALADPAAPGTVRVAVVSPFRIVNEMQETKAIRANLEAKRTQIMGQQKALQDQIDQLLIQRQNVNPKHPNFRKISDQIDQAKANLQGWMAAVKAGADRDQKEMLLNLFEKIEAAAAEIAQKNNIDLVLTDGRADLTNLEDAPAEEIRRLLNQRTVLYASKAADITEQVITLLDAKYAQQGGPPALPAPGK